VFEYIDEKHHAVEAWAVHVDVLVNPKTEGQHN
jgi:hypothetical protein